MKMLGLAKFAEAVGVTQSTLCKWRNIKKHNIPMPDEYRPRPVGSKAPYWKETTVKLFIKQLKEQQLEKLKNNLNGQKITKKQVQELIPELGNKEKIAKHLKITITGLTLFCKLNGISLKSIGSTARPAEEAEHSPKYLRAFNAANDALNLVVRKSA